MTATKEQYQDTGEMMRLRVVNPPKTIYDAAGNKIGGSVFNGYKGYFIKDADGRTVGESPGRVYLGWETAIPLYRPFRDEEGNHLRNPDGSLKWKKQGVPKWAELVEILPPPRGWQPIDEEAPKSTVVSPLARSAGGRKAGSTKSFGRSTRAADANIGE